MANELIPNPSQADFSAKRIAVVVSSYNDSITGKLKDGAVETLLEKGVADEKIDVVQVPGAWELALAAQHLVDRALYDGIVCLGAVIKGETTHDQHINRFVSQALGQLSMESRIPIGFGLLTCENFQQAHDRAGGKVGNKGHEAVMAVLEMVDLCDRLSRR